MTRSALIVGLAGTELSAEEAAFLRSACPAGIILFSRNLADREQVARLTSQARDAAGSDLLVLIDQEGGRVQRLRPPLGRALPPARAYVPAFADAHRAAVAARAVARLLADDLRALGINCNCAPVLDRPVEGAHQIIGDRAYHHDAEAIAVLGRAVAEGLMAGGVLPVMKHVPGHGRATADSHLALPVVDTPRAELEATDFLPFRRLADLPAAMTAHVVYADIDARAPASTSVRMTRQIIREHIGFDGLLMSDDLGMQALSGPIGRRAAAVIAAGSDLALHCSGNLAEMREVAAEVPRVEGAALRRLQRARAICAQCAPYDAAEAERDLATVLADHLARSGTGPVESV